MQTYAYDLTLRLRPGVKRSIEGGKEYINVRLDPYRENLMFFGITSRDVYRMYCECSENEN